jgi:hypothetical protein
MIKLPDHRDDMGEVAISVIDWHDVISRS